MKRLYLATMCLLSGMTPIVAWSQFIPGPDGNLPRIPTRIPLEEFYFTLDNQTNYYDIRGYTIWSNGPEHRHYSHLIPPGQKREVKIYSIPCSDGRYNLQVDFSSKDGDYRIVQQWNDRDIELRNLKRLTLLMANDGIHAVPRYEWKNQ